MKTRDRILPADKGKRIAFLCRGFENLGVQILQAVCQKEGVHTRAFIDPAPDAVFLSNNPIVRWLGVQDYLIDQILAYKPDLICVSAFSSTWAPLTDLLGRIRQRIDVPIIAGGVGPTVSPKKAFADPNVDMVCVGDGEYLMRRVCEIIEQGGSFENIPGLWTKVNGEIIPSQTSPKLVELDTLPFPEKSDFYRAAMFRRTLRLVTGRGCPYNCSFCQNNEIKKINGRAFIRRHSPDYVLDMLAHMTEKYPVRQVMFLDSTFNSDIGFTERFLPRYYQKISLPYYCMIHARTMDRELAEIFGRTGCKEVLIGMETGDEDFRWNVYNKHITDEDLARSVHELQRAGVRVALSVIFGAPGETPDHYGKTLDMVEKLRPNHVTTFNFFPQPKTEITENAIEKGLLDPESVFLPNLSHGKYVLLHPYAAKAQTSNNLIPLFFLTPRFLSNWVRRWCLSGSLIPFTHILWKIFVPLANTTFTYIEGIDSMRAIFFANVMKLYRKVNKSSS